MSDEIIHLTSCCGNLFVTFSSGKTRAGVRAGPSSPTPTTQTLPIISIRTGRRRVVLATPVTTAPPRPAACTPARPLPHSLSCPRPCILDYASDCFFSISVFFMSSTFTFHPFAVFPYSSWISNTDLSIFFGYVSGCCPDLILVCVCVRTRRTQRLKTLVDCEKAIESLETVARLDAIKQGHIAEIPIGQALNFIHSISRISAPAELHSKVMKISHPEASTPFCCVQ